MKKKLITKLLTMTKILFYVLVTQLSTATILLATEDSNGQGRNKNAAMAIKYKPLSNITLSLQPRRLSLLEALNELNKTTGFRFTYSLSAIRGDQQIDLAAEEESLKEILLSLSKQGNLAFRRINERIIVSNKGNGAKRLVTETIQLKDKITGKVIDKDGDPLPGATVRIKETNVGTVTDHLGNFSLDVPDDAGTLMVSFVGFQTKEVSLTGATSFNIVLLADVTNLNQVVVIGYGTESKTNITTSIARVDSEEIKDQATTSFDQALAGRLPGVDISQANGAPGGSVGINIRGISSISGGNAPLIVVDGVPLSSSTSDRFSQGQSTNNSFSVGYNINPLSSINPSDIASVEILKDAAAAAIYGSRGSNGVILVTTKSGKAGQKPQINLNAYGGVQQVTTRVDVMGAYEFARYTKTARDLSWINKDPVNNSADDPLDQRATSGDRYASYLIPYINGETGLTDTDWQDEIFRDAPIQNYELSATGGTEKLGYYISGNYFNQEGTVRNSGLKRYGARLNLRATLSDRLRFGVNFNPSFSDYNIVQTEQNWWREGVIISSLMYHPNLPVRNADGSFALGDMIRTNRSGESSVAVIENPVALAELIDNSLDHTRLLSNAFVEMDIAENLTFKTSLGIDLNYMDRSYYRPKMLNWRNEYAPTSTNNYAWANASNVFNWLSENTLEYDRSFEGHHLRALLGYTAQKEVNKRQYLEGRNFPNDNVTTLNAAQTTTGYSEEREWSLLSYLGRIQYRYEDKYLLGASVRRDGSSRFGKNTKWGWFPSVSAGWRISNEEFFPGSSVISDLKLRASYGLTGNTEIPFYGGTALLDTEDYVFGDQVNAGLAPVTSPNSNLSWETTKTIDVGFDIGLFDNKLLITADYYRSNTEDLLLNVTVPGSSGFQSSLQNIGELENKGFELLISTFQKAGDFSWNGSLNFSTNKNEIVALAPGQSQFLVNGGLNDPAFIVRVGESIGSYFGYKVLGVFESPMQFEETPHLEGQNQGVGDFIYADIDGDGDVDPDDRTILGDNNPDFSWGFTSDFKYKGFDLSFNIQGKHGFELFNAMHRYLAETWGNNLAAYLGDDAPRPVWGVGSSSHTRPSSWHVEDGSFIRMRNITLGYTLPDAVISNQVLQNVRVYFSALNPFTITNYSGYNPEVSNNFGDAARAGEEFGNYPVSKSFVVGLNVTF